jgi:transposase
MVEAIDEAEGVVKHAADIMGCGRKTIYRYAKQYKTVQDAIDRGRETLVQEARDRMSEMMRNPEHRDHYKATVKILTVYDDELEWSDKERREYTGEGGGPVTFQVVNQPPEPDE